MTNDPIMLCQPHSKMDIIYIYIFFIRVAAVTDSQKLRIAPPKVLGVVSKRLTQELQMALKKHASTS